MAMVSTWQEPKGKTRYISTGREASPTGDKLDLACWLLSGKVDDSFPEQSATIGDVYYQVTRPMGMSLDETTQLVRECKKRGYLKVA